MAKVVLIVPFLAAAESHYQGVASSKLGETLIVITCLVVIATQLWNFVEKLKGGPTQKREVSFPAAYATKEELTQAHGRIKREREEVDAHLARMAAEMVRMREKMEEQVDDIQERVDLVPERVIKLLRETKGLI